MSVSEMSTVAKSLLERAARLPGCSATRSKAPGRLWPVGTGPHFAVDTVGAEIQADDGRWYLDTVCALGAISLGYDPLPPAPRRVCSLPYLAESRAGDAILEHVAPWATHWRPTKTGSEATTAALLIAQRATGRRVYWRLTGSYHGWHPHWQDDAPDARWFKVGDLPALDRDTAAVILEPPRWEAFTADWWRAVSLEARAVGALVIVDEMIWAGRMALGGATEHFGVIPDMACVGKAIGNGTPIACIVGRDVLRDRGEMISGTYSGDAVALEAVVAVLAAYQREHVVDWMWERGRQLQRGLDALCASYAWVHREGQPVHQRLVFDTEGQGHEFSRQMMTRGVLWAPFCTNLMRAHTEADITRVLEAADASLHAMELCHETES